MSECRRGTVCTVERLTLGETHALGRRGIYQGARLYGKGLRGSDHASPPSLRSPDHRQPRASRALVVSGAPRPRVRMGDQLVRGRGRGYTRGVRAELARDRPGPIPGKEGLGLVRGQPRGAHRLCLPRARRLRLPPEARGPAWGARVHVRRAVHTGPAPRVGARGPLRRTDGGGAGRRDTPGAHHGEDQTPHHGARQIAVGACSARYVRSSRSRFPVTSLSAGCGGAARPSSWLS